MDLSEVSFSRKGRRATGVSSYAIAPPRRLCGLSLPMKGRESRSFVWFVVL